MSVQPSKAVWKFYLVFAVVFAGFAVGLAVDPPRPSFGAKGFLFHAAYLLLGEYGPAMLTLGFAVLCLVMSVRQRRRSMLG